MRMGLLISNPDVYKTLYGTAAGASKMQFGAQEMFKDEDDNLFLGTLQMNPSTGQVEPVVKSLQGNVQPVGALTPAGGSYGETAEEVSRRKAKEQKTK